MGSRGEAASPGRKDREGIQEDVPRKWVHKHPNQEPLDLKYPCCVGPKTKHIGRRAENPCCFFKSILILTLLGWGWMKWSKRGRGNWGEVAIPGDHPLQRIPGSSYAQKTANLFSSVRTPNPIGIPDESSCGDLTPNRKLATHRPLPETSAWDGQMEAGGLHASSSTSIK